jgi:probable phosphomutase (TIGR03848 family)
VTTFFLVRHGVTAHTGQRLSGWLPDIHLTELGVAQAEAVAEFLSDVGLDAVYSSPIERSMETAAPIARRQNLKIQRRRRLGEVEFGRWTNRSFATLRRTKLWARVQRFPSGIRFPGGETFVEVQRRAVEELEALKEAHPKQALCCVSHADVIKLIAAHYLGVHIDLFQRIEIGPASTTVIAIGEAGPKVLSMNVPPRMTEKR